MALGQIAASENGAFLWDFDQFCNLDGILVSENGAFDLQHSVIVRQTIGGSSEGEKAGATVTQWKFDHVGMSEYPANSAGDLFRLLPFEGYAGVLSFLPVWQLQIATQISKGWKFAVGSRAATYDASATCKDISHLTDFLTSLTNQDL